MEHIRNFVIIAHIDAGKSTLADRFLEITGTVRPEKMRPQYLDRLELERERGITIKMAPVRMSYTLNAQPYTLNLIDTPGHSDFSYEVSRALAAVEGAVLLVDGTKGIQAQTLANFRAAQRAGLTMLGAVNKVDLDLPNLDRTITELADLLGVPNEDIARISAKTGIGTEALLQKIVERVPPPRSRADDADMTRIDADNIRVHQRDNQRLFAMPSRALIFDSLYDDHKGIIAFVRVFDGEIKTGDTISFLRGGTSAKAKEVGYFNPDFFSTKLLGTGEIGYIATGLKEPARVKIGDTVISGRESQTVHRTNFALALPDYREPKPVVYVSFYPDGETRFEDLRTGLARLHLTDAALEFSPDANDALGRGMKVGFLGQLHFDITASRLEREFNLQFITSFPSIAYRIQEEKNERVITTPQDFPDKPDRVWQPMIAIEIVTPAPYLSSVMSLRTPYDLAIKETKTWGEHLILTGTMPLAELIRDFDDALKTVSQGYASWSYELAEEVTADVQKLEILVAEEVVPALTRIVPRKDVEYLGRQMAERLKNMLPKQQFPQAIQAKAEGRIIARETIPALKKLLGNFGKTGGDRTRKMKLWKKQQRGKARLKERGTGRVHVPPHLFKELLKK